MERIEWTIVKSSSFQLGTLLSCHVLAERLEELLVAGETAGAGSRGSLRYF